MVPCKSLWSRFYKVFGQEVSKRVIVGSIPFKGFERDNGLSHSLLFFLQPGMWTRIRSINEKEWAEIQCKCMGKEKQVAKAKGRTEREVDLDEFIADHLFYGSGVRLMEARKMGKRCYLRNKKLMDVAIKEKAAFQMINK